MSRCWSIFSGVNFISITIFVATTILFHTILHHKHYGLDCYNHSCQNVNRIVNQFLIFSYRISYRIMYRKIHKHILKFIKIINIHI